MNREEKNEIVQDLKEKMSTFGHFYLTDTSNLTVAKINAIRRACFDKNITIQVAENTLIRKALEASGDGYDQLFDSLKGSTAIMFSETANAPAKLIKELRKRSDKPVLKAAYVESSIYVGDNQLDSLVNLKSKNELIGDIIGLLQSPAKNVISGLQSGGNKLAGIVKTLSERAE